MKQIVRLGLLFFLLCLPMSLGPTAHSEENQVIINRISNPGFETSNLSWEWKNASGFASPVDYDSSRSRPGGKLSARLLATPTAPGSTILSQFLGDLDQNTTLANIADADAGLSAWWYVEPAGNGPDSIVIELSFSDRVSRYYTLGYFYGTSHFVNFTSSPPTTFRQIYYRIASVPDSGTVDWFDTRRNLYSDILHFNIPDRASFHFTQIRFVAFRNSTHGETVWVDDVQLLFNPPIPKFSVSRPDSSELTFQFDASKSQPSKEASIVRYTWNLGDGSSQTYDKPQLTYTYESPSAYQVSLEIEDNKGRVSATSQIILASKTRPNDLALFSPLAAYLSGSVLIGFFSLVLVARWRRRRNR